MARRNRTIPERESDIITWVRNFTNHIVVDPEAYNLTVADADQLQALCDELTLAFIAARRPDTRTRTSIVAKNDCMDRTLEVFRSYVHRVKADTTITDAQMESLGIVPRNRRSSPVPAPKDPPQVRVTHKGLYEHVVQVRDAQRRGRCKPHGVSHVVLLCAVGDGPISDPTRARYVGAFTHGPIHVRFGSREHDKVATYFAAWLTGSGAQSSWARSQPTLIVTAGAPPMVDGEVICLGETAADDGAGSQRNLRIGEDVKQAA
jgi:hypothetical protein